MIIRATTERLEAVRRIMTDESVYLYITDDGCPSGDEFDPAEMLENKSIFTLMPDENSLAIFTPVNAITYEQHSCVLPESRRRTNSLARHAWKWMFTETPCQKIITWVPGFNLRAEAAAVKVGFNREGISTKSYLWKGVKYDQILFGLTMEEWSCL